jgi:hypothetical protein
MLQPWRDSDTYSFWCTLAWGSLRYFILYRIEYKHAYIPRFIPKGVAEASQIFFRDHHVLPKLQYCRQQMRNTADVTGGKLIAVWLQSISGVSAINPLVAFYDIHGIKREVLLFYFSRTPHEDWIIIIIIIEKVFMAELDKSLLYRIKQSCFPLSAPVYT